MNARQKLESLIEQAVFLGYKDWIDVPDEIADEIAEARLAAMSPFEAREIIINASGSMQASEAARMGDWIKFYLTVRSNLKDEFKDMQDLFDVATERLKTEE